MKTGIKPVETSFNSRPPPPPLYDRRIHAEVVQLLIQHRRWTFQRRGLFMMVSVWIMRLISGRMASEGVYPLYWLLRYVWQVVWLVVLMAVVFRR